VVPSPPAVGPKPNVATTAPKFSGRSFLVRGEWRIESDELAQLPQRCKKIEELENIFGGW
jgi:hypothetical protein